MKTAYFQGATLNGPGLALPPQESVAQADEFISEVAMENSGTDDPQTARRRHRRRIFEQEVERLTDRLYGTALRLTRDPGDAEDVVAEAVSRAWAKLEELRDEQQFEGWLFRILNNTFVDVWRRRKSRQDRETELDLSDTDASGPVEFSLFQQLHQPFLLWWGTPEDSFLNGLLREDIQRALDELPDAFRVVIILVEVQGYTYAEVSDLLDVPLGTVRSRLNRARSLLQKSLWQQAREAGLEAHSGQRSSRPGGGDP